MRLKVTEETRICKECKTEKPIKTFKNSGHSYTHTCNHCRYARKKWYMKKTVIRSPYATTVITEEIRKFPEVETLIVAIEMEKKSIPRDEKVSRLNRIIARLGALTEAHGHGYELDRLKNRAYALVRWGK